MKNDFKFVIVGTGNIATTYVDAINKLSGVSLVGAVSRSGNTPKNVSTPSFEVVHDLAEIRNDFDAVILTTPNGLHHEGALQAAELGKHVLTEKPLDVTIEAIDKMIDTFKDKNLKLGVAYQRRMSPDNQVIKALLEKKALGRIYATNLSIPFFRGQDYYDSASYRGVKAIDGGGPFVQQGSHNIDIYCWFFGMPKQIVSMMDTFAHKIEVEDHGVALLRHEDGMIGTITASTIAKPGFPTRLEFHSESGTVVLENDIITVWEIEGMENPSQMKNVKIHNGASSASVADTWGHERIIEDFTRAVLDNRAPAISGFSAKMATELILKIYKNSI